MKSVPLHSLHLGCGEGLQSELLLGGALDWNGSTDVSESRFRSVRKKAKTRGRKGK